MKQLNLLVICLAFATISQAQKVLTIENEALVSGNWTPNSKITFGYDANCYLVTTLFQNWNANTSMYDNFLLNTYTNNTDGTVSQVLGQSWKSGSWKNASRETFTYTSFGKTETLLSESYLFNSWTKFIMITYTYDPNNYLIQDSSTILFPITGPASKDNFTNNGDGSPNQIINQRWVVASWENARRESITYYNNNPAKRLTDKIK